MSEQPALNDDAVASFIATIRDLVKAERERDVALAALARVRALADECDRREAEDEPRAPWRMLAAAIRFRAALEGP